MAPLGSTVGTVLNKTIEKGNIKKHLRVLSFFLSLSLLFFSFPPPEGACVRSSPVLVIVTLVACLLYGGYFLVRAQSSFFPGFIAGPFFVCPVNESLLELCYRTFNRRDHDQCLNTRALYYLHTQTQQWSVLRSSHSLDGVCILICVMVG